jgi:hypothetical protein
MLTDIRDVLAIAKLTNSQEDVEFVAMTLWKYKRKMMNNEVSNNLPIHFYHTRNGYGDAIFVFDNSHG